MTCPLAVVNGIFAHAREARPAECCGVLIGTGDEIVDAVRIRNLARDLDRYLLDPREHIEARRDARRRGLEVLGFYHSHPGTIAEPSATDLAEATYPDLVYLILSPGENGAGAGDAGLFRLLPGGFVRVPLVLL